MLKCRIHCHDALKSKPGVEKILANTEQFECPTNAAGVDIDTPDTAFDGVGATSTPLSQQKWSGDK